MISRARLSTASRNPSYIVIVAPLNHLVLEHDEEGTEALQRRAIWTRAVGRIMGHSVWR